MNATRPDTKPTGGLRLIERIWYAFGDLNNRRLATGMNLMAAALPVIVLLHLAHYGLGVYRYKQSLLEDYLPMQIVVNCANANDTRTHITAADLARMAALPGARTAYRKTEIGVNLSYSGGKSLNVQAEGTVPDAPDVSGSRLVWGNTIGGGAAAETVVPMALFERIGGTLTSSGPVPAKVRLEIARTHDGVPQQFTTEVKVVGLLRSQTGDKLYIPAELALRFDQWCSGKIDGTPGNPGETGFPEPKYDRVFAYVPKAEQHRVAEDIGVYKAVATKVDDAEELTVVRSDADIWVALRKDNQPASPDVQKELNEYVFEFNAHPVRVLKIEVDGKERRLVAMNPDDPRWQFAPQKKAPEFGQIIPTGPTAALNQFTTITAPVAGLPGGGDFYCTPDTQRWLIYQWKKSPAIGTHTYIQTNDIATAMSLNRQFPGEVTASQPLGFVLIDAAKDQWGRSNINQLEAWAFRYGKVKSGPVFVGQLPGSIVEVGDVITTAVDQIPVPGPRLRFVPKAVFDRMLGAAKPSGSGVSCIHFARKDRPHDPPRDLGGRPLNVLKTIPAKTDEFCLPETERKTICPLAKPAGIAVWGEWPHFGGVIENLAQSEIPCVIRMGEAPTGFSALVKGDKAAVEKQLGVAANHCTATEYATVRAAIHIDGTAFVGICARNTTLREKTAVLASVPSKAGSADAALDDFRVPVTLNSNPDVPTGLAMVDEVTFRRLAFETDMAAGTLTRVGEPEFAIRVSPLRWTRLREVCNKLDLTIKPLTRVATETWVKYEVKAEDGGKFPGGMVSVMGQNSVTFPGLAPVLTTKGFVGKKERVLNAAAPDDPRQFEAGLSYGRWLANNPREAVLPAALLKERFPMAKPEESVGREVDMTFQRDARAAALEPALTMAVTVVGVSDGDEIFLSHDLTHGIELWKQGKANYNNERKHFMTPAQEFDRAGFVRANVFADSPDAVGPLVGQLSAMGFKCEDNRHKQDGLRQLGLVLAGIVGVFYFFFALMGAMMVFLTTAMNIQNKRWEIGILKAHGVSRWEITSIFSLQGILLGLAAGVGGIVIAMVVEPGCSWIIREGFMGLPNQSLSGSLAATAPFWLIAGTAALTVAVSLFGAAIPAAWMSRMKPVDALRPAG